MAESIGTVEKVARIISPAIWMAFDREGRDGRATDKASEVLILQRARLSTLKQAAEIIGLVTDDLGAFLLDAVGKRLDAPASTEIQQEIAAELKRRVTAAHAASQAEQ